MFYYANKIKLFLKIKILKILIEKLFKHLQKCEKKREEKLKEKKIGRGNCRLNSYSFIS